MAPLGRQPMSPSERWLIRHAESAANAGAATSDPASIPLSEAGADAVGCLGDRRGITVPE